jgi:hypothetical protein
MKQLHLKKRYKIILGIGLFIAVLLFAVPRFGRWYIVKHSREIIGRKLEIQKIRINYFTGTFRINEVKLYESDSKSVFLSFNQLKVNLEYLPLLKNEILVKSISLDDPFVEVLQNSDKFNFSDLTASDTAKSVTDTLPSKPMKYIINNIRISGGYVKYTDVNLNHTIALNKLDLLIPGFTWNSDSTNLDVDFRFVDGGGLSSKLEINQTDSTYSLNLKLDSLNLDIIEPYLKSNMHISGLHGYLSNNVQIKGNMRSVMQLFLKGINHVYDCTLSDTLNRKILSFKEMTIDINSLQPDKNILDLNYIGITDPYLFFEMIDSTNNWLTLLKPSVSTPTDTLQKKSDTASESGTGSYTFSRFQISGGKIQFSDKTLRYPFDYTIENIKLESTPVKAGKGKLTFTLSAGLNGTGTLNMEALIDPSNFKDLDLNMSVGQFRMKEVDAYFKHYFGFPVTGGIMNFKTDNKIRPESFVSNNSLFFRKFTLDKAMKGKVEYHVPLRLALGILSDKDGIIDLKAPVESKGEDVRVKNLGKIVLKIIGNLFIKAATSPFNLLSASYKVDPASLQEIRLDLMDPSPDVRNLKSVDIISDILNKKPGLNIDFYYCINRSVAADSLAYLMTLEEYSKDNTNPDRNLKNVADSTLIKYLKTKSSSASSESNLGIKILCRNFIGTKNLDAKIDSMKALQISFLANYLNHDKELPADRFKIIAVAPDTIKPFGKYPSFRSYFTASGEK